MPLQIPWKSQSRRFPDLGPRRRVWVFGYEAIALQRGKSGQSLDVAEKKNGLTTKRMALYRIAYYAKPNN
jgi:hypothetical protein